MQVCKYASMQVCKFASMQVSKYASMQVCKYASMQVCKYASMQVCKYARMHLCEYASMRHDNCNFILVTWFLLPDTRCIILVTHCDQCCHCNSASQYFDQNMNGILVDFCRTTVTKIMEDIKIDMKRLSDQSLRKTAIVELRKCSDMYHYVDILIFKMLWYVQLSW